MKVLLVTAHPDDECMFFYPSISGLQGTGHSVFVLCLSSGDAEGLGSRRKCELFDSCSALGIQRSRIKIVEDSALLDGMENDWDPATVKRHVIQTIEEWEPDILLTFDEYGVSGHRNHIDTHKGVVNAWRHCQEHCANLKGRLYTLRSSNIVTKYSGMASIITLPFDAVFLGSKKYRYTTNTYINFNLRKVWQAMSRHYSQWTWYRRLFVLFSQYPLYNIVHNRLYE